MTENPGEDDSFATPEQSSADDTPEEQESPRELLVEYAGRIAILGLFVPPLQLYVSWLLLQIYWTPGTLDEICQRRLRLTVVLNVGMGCAFAFFAGCLLYLFTTTADEREDLLRYPHPQQLVGRWRYPVSADGLSFAEYDLRADGHMVYRAVGDSPAEAVGSWGYDRGNFQLVFRLDRFTQGDWEHKGQLVAWLVMQLKDDELILEAGRDKLALKRHHGP